MSSGSTLILAVLAVCVMCVAVSAASRRHVTAWNYYHFDGHAFVAGPSDDDRPFLAVRDRAVPVVLTRAAQAEATPLPPDKGALAGICFLRSSGGKLAGGRSYTACPRTPITISSGKTVVTSVLSDQHGYFVALLVAGSYRISNGIFDTEAIVVKGATVIVPLLAGKRMVD
jgi:hypothetical protein